MNRRITELTEKIRGLEAELAAEIQRIRIRTYEIRDRTIHFSAEMKRSHRAQATHLLTYLRNARLKHILTAPVIWCCLVPALLMDLVVSLYQSICFPVYGIPKVRRRDHIVIDRHHLAYLNLIEKANCVFCSYFNGLVSYIGEVAGRTEQYWCPIKHAAQLKRAHSRYERFTEYGDADGYRNNARALRQDFNDVDQAPMAEDR
jgi:hypothetical protein